MRVFVAGGSGAIGRRLVPQTGGRWSPGNRYNFATGEE